MVEQGIVVALEHIQLILDIRLNEVGVGRRSAIGTLVEDSTWAAYILAELACIPAEPACILVEHTLVQGQLHMAAALVPHRRACKGKHYLTVFFSQQMLWPQQERSQQTIVLAFVSRMIDKVTKIIIIIKPNILPI